MKKLLVLTVLLLSGLTLSACTEESPDPITCDEGYILQGEECVLDTPTCEEGFELVNGECVEEEPDPIVCDEGENLNVETNECEPEPLVCEEGYSEQNGECVEIRCVPGYVVVDGQCVEDTAAQVCKGINYEYDKSELVYDLVWSDEFDGTELDSTKWVYEVNGNGGGNNELQYYTSDNVVVEDGFLKIIAEKEDYNGKEYTSSRITTQYKGEFKYGIFEARIKMPPGRGTWAAFWMMPVNSVYGGWPNSGEIDIVELVGYDPTKVHATIHTERFNHKDNTQRGGTKTTTTATSEFHVYKVEWLPDRLNFYVDDVQYFTFIAGTTGICPDEDAWPFDKTFFMILNVAIGGDWGGAQGVDDTIFPTTMEVDWVRVYQSQEITDLEQTNE